MKCMQAEEFGAKRQHHELKMLSAVLALADSTLLLRDVVGCAVHIALGWSGSTPAHANGIRLDKTKCCCKMCSHRDCILHARATRSIEAVHSLQSKA